MNRRTNTRTSRQFVNRLWFVAYALAVPVLSLAYITDRALATGNDDLVDSLVLGYFPVFAALFVAALLVGLVVVKAVAPAVWALPTTRRITAAFTA